MHLFVAVLMTAGASLPIDAPCLHLSCLSSNALRRLSSDPAPAPPAPCADRVQAAVRGPLLVAAGAALIGLGAWMYARKDHEDDPLAAGLSAMTGWLYGAHGAGMAGVGTYFWIKDTRCRERRDGR
jgi:hypothetical protein